MGAAIMKKNRLPLMERQTVCSDGALASPSCPG